MKKNLIFTAICALTLCSSLLMSQAGDNLKSAEPNSDSISDNAAAFLATNAKYHVVIGVLVVIFAGLVVYGLILNRKISNLEAKQK